LRAGFSEAFRLAQVPSCEHIVRRICISTHSGATQQDRCFMPTSPTRNYFPVWHPDVHRGILDEELYFIFLNSYGDFDEFAKAVTGVLESLLKGRYSLYHVFGNYDIIVRLWARRSAYNSLLAELREQCRAFAGSVQQFNVDKTFYLWSEFPKSLPPEVLDSVSRDQIRAVQAGDTGVIARFRSNGVIVGEISGRPPYGSDGKFKSLMMVQFLRETSSILHIVQDELITELSSHFPTEQVSLYFGFGLGTLLVKQIATDMRQFLKLGDHIRKKLRLLRANSSTYLVAQLVLENDNGDAEVQSNNEPLSEEARALIQKYPDAKSLRIDDLFVAMALNERAIASIRLCPGLKNGFSLLIRSFIGKDRGQLLQAISSFVEELERVRKDAVPSLCKRAFSSGWETETNSFIKEKLKKGKPLAELSLGEILHFIRELNALHLHLPELDKEWEESLSRFISIRNDAFHKPETIALARIYEIGLAAEALASSLKSLQTLAGDPDTRQC